ncbi:MAG: prepilin-type N-terminal cleavage/methylation domain-containing protein, partial [Rhodoferax sp.]
MAHIPMSHPPVFCKTVAADAWRPRQARGFTLIELMIGLA